jgi:hypothetical protein
MSPIPARWRTRTPLSPARIRVARFLDRLTREEAQRYYKDFVGPYFVPGRTADLDMAQQAIDAVAAELGIAPVAAEAMYGLAGKSIASI